MKVLLTTLNSKFIHSNLAIKYINAMIKNLCIAQTVEFTINEDIEDILGQITETGCDLVAFSCYIWNIEKTLKIAENLKKIKPETMILFGGPEVSYDAKKLMTENKFIDFVVIGEGERGMLEVIESFDLDSQTFELKKLRKIQNLFFREAAYGEYNETMIKGKGLLDIIDLSVIPPIYMETKSEDIANKIVYYETSRGCTFNCAYCLSSTTKGVRYFDMDRTKLELSHLVKLGAKQIKFVDRTFNSDEEKAIELITYLMEIDNGTINFHFEITAHLLQQRILDIIKTARQGLFQFEIGVQSTNEKTLTAVNRANKFEKLSKNVLQIKSYENIHQHLDLIAGLPYETLESFKKSFNDVFSLKPDALQLGFLKILKGSPIEKTINEHEYKFRSYPPYEILENKYLTFDEISILKKIEDLVDRLYNTGKCKYSIGYLYESCYKNKGYQLFEELYEQVNSNKLNLTKKEEEYRAVMFLGKTKKGIENFNYDFFKEMLRLDYINMGRNPNIPEFINNAINFSNSSSIKELIFEFTKKEENLRELEFPETIYYKEAFKKIGWTFFEYDVIQYIINQKIQKNNNVLIINYDSQKSHKGDYKMVRRKYEI